MRRTLTTIVCVLLIPVFLAGCQISRQLGYSDKREVVKLGFIGPLTGEGASYGADQKNATLLAVEEINSNGYIPGKRLEVVIEDGQCSGKGGATAAQKLINVDKVKMIVGFACSDETLAAAPIAQAAEVIILASFSSNPAITNAGDFIFRNVPDDSASGILAANLISQKYKKAAVLSENSTYAIGVRDSFIKQMEENGGEVVADEIYNVEQKDFRTHLLKIESKKPEVIFINPQTDLNAGLIIKQVRELGLVDPVYGTLYFGGADTMKSAGDAALEGVIFVDVQGVAGEKGEKFLARFKERFGDPQNQYLVGAQYDSIYILADAIKTVGLDTSNTRDYLYGLKNYEGTLGSYHFDKNGDVVGVGWRAMTIHNGQVVPYEDSKQ